MALRIAVITDIHYGIDIGAKKGTQALPLVDEFIDAAAAFKADLILNLGDEISTRDPESDEKFKATLRHHFNRAACPVIKIDGNHCVRFQERQSVSRSFDMDKFHIVMWNPYMNRYTRDGVIPDPQEIEWLENDLAGTDKPTIILSHIPFRGPESEKKQLKRAQTATNVRVQRVESTCLVRADPKEVQPPSQVRIQPGDARIERASPVARNKLDEPFADPLFRACRQEHFDLSLKRLAPHAEADEMPLLWSGNSALRLVHFEAQAPLDELLEARHHPHSCTFALHINIAVIRIADEAMSTSSKL